jgi:type II secretory pathway component PulC
VTRRNERVLVAGLWALYGMLALGGVTLLALTLFSLRPNRSLRITADQGSESAEKASGGLPDIGGLAEKRMTRKVIQPLPAEPPTPPPVPLESFLRLTGILDFEGRSPSIAVMETQGESKRYKAGDRVGETGAVVMAVTDCVLLEYRKRRFRMTFKGVKEVPANALGSKD